MAIASTAPAEGLNCSGIFTGLTPLGSIIGPGPRSTHSGTPSSVIDMRVLSSSCSRRGRIDFPLAFLRVSLGLPKSSLTEVISEKGRPCHQRLRSLMGRSPDVDEGSL